MIFVFMFGFMHMVFSMTLFLHSYLSKRRHRTKVNKFFSSWEELIKGVPPRICHRTNLIQYTFKWLAEFTEVCNFADGATFHACDNDLNNLINRLEHNIFLVEWFEASNMKLNKDKCHLEGSGISIKMFGLKWGMKNFEKVHNKHYLEWK